MKFIISQLITILLLLLNNSYCKEKYPIDINGFTYRNKLNFNNQIKIDGLYYVDMILSENSITIIYLFSDGTYCRFATKNYNENNPTCYNIDKLRDIPYYWGAYIIERDTLKVQTFDPGSRQRYRKFKVEERWAIIENDTTLRFFRKITPEKKVLEMNEVFHYKNCENKPDSTNLLMQY